MLFSSNIFLFFFLPLVLAGYYLLTSNNSRNVFLLAASLFFYAWGEPKFVLIMILSIVFNYYSALAISKRKTFKTNKRINKQTEKQTEHSKVGEVKIIMALVVCFNLGILFVFKYVDFFINIINYTFNSNIMPTDIRLPIGISFFTFQALSYVIDVYRNPDIVQRNILNVGLYIFFFPQLIAGPIVRYTTIEKQISFRNENMSDFSDGVCRFTRGLGKKVLLANSFALIADKAFELNILNELSVSFAWLGIVAYTLQIYYDFSGYSDMAIGLGKMFGFHFLENFNYPYISKSITEFWRRWHISLGTWFRDYVYIPLGGSRSENTIIIVRNLFVVWLLTGIWHGASMNFIIWGLMYFALLCFEKFILVKIERTFVINSLVKHGCTLLWVMVGWVIFRAEGMSTAFMYIKSMFGFSGSYFYTPLTSLYINENLFILLTGIIFSMPIVPLMRDKVGSLQGNFKLVDISVSTALVVFYISIFVVSVSYLAKGTYNPFIYFNF